MSFEKNYKEKFAKLAERGLLSVTADFRGRLGEVIRYSLEAGGKRIRPILTLAFCEAYGGDIKKALPVAVAVEILHTSTLIQDDLPCMDDDDIRRGKPACHKAFSESDALLAASAMSYEAILLIAGSGLAQTARIIEGVCLYMSAVYNGQQLDLQYAGQNLSKEETLAIYEMKTCALLQAACVSGTLAAESEINKKSKKSEKSEARAENAAEYAYNLGLAFQLIDDILDGENYEEAKKDAEEYTLKALKALENVPNNEFLTELTKELLNRKM